MVVSQINETLFVVVAKLFGELREIIGLKINGKGEFFAFTPCARLPGSVDVHASKHRSGERHFTISVGKNRQPMPETKLQLQPPSSFRGIEPLMSMFTVKGQFIDLRLPGTNRGEIISLDLDSANFVDDMTFVKIYLLEPNKEELVPTPSDVGPRVLHFIKKTSPWLAVDIFQQAQNR